MAAGLTCYGLGYVHDKVTTKKIVSAFLEFPCRLTSIAVFISMQLYSSFQFYTNFIVI